MRNLAGVDPYAAANADVLEELAAAGIPPIADPAPRGEVRAQYFGALRFADGRTVTFRRAWCYWTVACEPAIPAADAHAINDRPHSDPGTKYSGSETTLGGVVRAFGFAGGMDRESLAKWCDGWRGGCDSYHIDTAAGLAAFVAALTERYGPPVAASACSSEVRRG